MSLITNSQGTINVAILQIRKLRRSANSHSSDKASIQSGRKETKLDLTTGLANPGLQGISVHLYVKEKERANNLANLPPSPQPRSGSSLNNITAANCFLLPRCYRFGSQAPGLGGGAEPEDCHCSPLGEG